MKESEHVDGLKELISKDKESISKIFCDNCEENLVFTFKKDEALFQYPNLEHLRIELKSD